MAGKAQQQGQVTGTPTCPSQEAGWGTTGTPDFLFMQSWKPAQGREGGRQGEGEGGKKGTEGSCNSIIKRMCPNRYF